MTERKKLPEFHPTEQDHDLGRQWADENRGQLDEEIGDCVYTREEIADAFAHGFAAGKQCALAAAKMLVFRHSKKGPEQ